MHSDSLGNVQDIVGVLKDMPKNRHCLRSDALETEPEKRTWVHLIFWRHSLRRKLQGSKDRERHKQGYSCKGNLALAWFPGVFWSINYITKLSSPWGKGARVCTLHKSIMSLHFPSQGEASHQQRAVLWGGGNCEPLAANTNSVWGTVAWQGTILQTFSLQEMSWQVRISLRRQT